jgi:hypothetical protein
VTRTILTRIARALQPFWLPFRSRPSSTLPTPRTGIPGTDTLYVAVREQEAREAAAGRNAVRP